MRRHLMTSILALAASSASAADAERIVQAPVPGFAVGFSASRNGQHIEEKVPTGETVQRWTRMITTQRFDGVVHRLQPAQLLQNMTDGLRTGCPGGRTTPIRRMTISGRPAAEMQADCPRNPATGLPETFIVRAIAGAADMHVVQVAFRRIPSAADLNWARAHLATVRICVGGCA